MQVELAMGLVGNTFGCQTNPVSRILYMQPDGEGTLSDPRISGRPMEGVAPLICVSTYIRAHTFDILGQMPTDLYSQQPLVPKTQCVFLVMVVCVRILGQMIWEQMIRG